MFIITAFQASAKPMIGPISVRSNVIALPFVHSVPKLLLSSLFQSFISCPKSPIITATNKMSSSAPDSIFVAVIEGAESSIMVKKHETMVNKPSTADAALVKVSRMDCHYLTTRAPSTLKNNPKTLPVLH